MPLSTASKSDYCDKPCSLCDAARQTQQRQEGEPINCDLCLHDPEKRPGEINLPDNLLHQIPEHLRSDGQKKRLREIGQNR